MYGPLPEGILCLLLIDRRLQLNHVIFIAHGGLNCSWPALESEPIEHILVFRVIVCFCVFILRLLRFLLLFVLVATSRVDLTLVAVSGIGCTLGAAYFNSFFSFG